MADQKRWFKVWSTIALDPSFLALPVESIGRWTLLGAWVAAHGEKGVIKAPEAALRYVLRCDNGMSVEDVLQSLPHVRGSNDNGVFTVIMENWSKYQLDSTGYERLKRHRATLVKRSKRRLREDKEKNTDAPAPAPPAALARIIETLGQTTNLKPLVGPGFRGLWTTLLKTYGQYGWLNIPDQLTRADAWIAANPQRAPTPRGLGAFVRNWLDKAVEIGRKNAGPSPPPARDPNGRCAWQCQACGEVHEGRLSQRGSCLRKEVAR